MNSDTPRTDAAACDGTTVPADFAADLERELDAAKAEVERLREDAETWKFLYCRAINEANGLTNYIEDRPELYSAEKRLTTIQEDARAALKETK
jgi:hypothetical protein